MRREPHVRFCERAAVKFHRATHLIIGFEHATDARRFWDAMRERLAEYSLSLNPDKTRLIEFGRFAAAQRIRRGLGKPETFKFLGFTFICGRSRRGRFALKRNKYFRQALEHDPNYSVAYVCLGFAYMFDYQNRWTENPDGSLQIAKEYARQAIEKDPNEPLARCVSALVASYEKDLDRAKTEIDAALALNAPTTRVRRRISRMIRSNGLLSGMC